MPFQFKSLFLVITGMIVLGSSFDVRAHSEPHKSRFVSEKGVDQGQCDSPIRPCKTIMFAVKNANKGDKILVASGSYSISSIEEVFYLKSEVIPIFAGYNRFDHFQSQSPDVNKVYLQGVPQELVDSVRKNGFHVIADGKSQFNSDEINQQLKNASALFEKQTAINCVNGMAGSFPCNNLDLLAHVPLNQMSSRPSSGSDIWGHVDLNNGREYAIMGVRNGAAVFDVTDPENPTEIGTISGTSSTWRDIKVYQYFDETASEWRAYAYVTVEASDGVTIIDLNQLPTRVSLVERNNAVGNSHNVYISNIDHALNIKEDGVLPKLQLLGANRYSGSFHSYSLANPATISVESNQSSFQGYTHDGASTTIRDSRKDTNCYNGTTSCTVFVDFNEKSIAFWDMTNPTDTRLLSNVSYNDVPASAQYVHSGWFSEDKRYVFVHDEFDEYQGGLNSTVRVYDVNNFRAPVQVGQWTGATRAIDHNGFVRGNRYYMSNYERGLTVLDISDASNPVQVGYFDTFPTSNNNQFNGAWGTYPYLPSGNILVSDINSGLYILKDNTKTNSQGQASFRASEFSAQRGQTLQIPVSRLMADNAAQTASVDFELISGSAKSGSDFTMVRDTLEWIGNDVADKIIEIEVAEDSSGTQPEESFFIRLFNPTTGMTLGQFGYLQVNLSGVAQPGAIEWTQSNVDIIETASSIAVTVARVGGSDGASSIDYQVVSGTATAGEDFLMSSGTLTWADGNSESRTVTVELLDDSINEDDEVFTVELSNPVNSTLASNTSIQVTILDNETNSLPQVNLGEDIEVNSGATVEIQSITSDADGDALTFAWSQVSGTSVTLSDTAQSAISFTAPSTGGDLVFELSVSDSRGGESTDQIKVTVVAPSSSGGALFIGLGLLVLLFQRKRQSL